MKRNTFFLPFVFFLFVFLPREGRSKLRIFRLSWDQGQWPVIEEEIY